MLLRALAIASGICVVGLAADAPAGACSCVQPHALTVSPALKATDVPRNARALALVAPDRGRLVLRRRKGEDIPAKERHTAQGEVNLVELAPNAPLAASTEYEILVRKDGASPPNEVIGFFTTGTTSDTTPPVLGSRASARVENAIGRMRSPCAPPDAFVAIDASGTDDRGPVLLGAWVARKGVFDLQALPDAVGEPGGSGLSLGKSSLCSFADHDFPARGGPVAIMVAAFDPAGNQSKSRRFDVVVPPRAR